MRWVRHHTVITLVLLAACGGDPVPAPDAVARLAGTEILYPSFESYLQRNIHEPGSSLPSTVLSQLFDQFLDEKLLVQLAVDRELVPTDTGARLAVAALLAANRDSTEPTHQQIENYYGQHLDQFQRPERVRLSQILVEDRAAAQSAARQLAAGTPFVEVARNHSNDPATINDGGQGLLARSDLPKPFADTIFALEPGTVSDIIPAEYGFHIFLVNERLPATELPLHEAEPEIRSQLRRDLTEQRLAELVREARDRYEPKIFVRNLPFNYQGRNS